MRARRHPGIHDAVEERVLLVTKDRSTGAERCDWWPSVEEAKASNQEVLEERDRIRVERKKKDWTGLDSLLNLVLGASGTQDHYVRDRPFDQKEFFEPVDEKIEARKRNRAA